MVSFMICLFCLQACFKYGYSNFITTGKLFKETKANDLEKLKDDETFIKSELFRCDRTASCAQVVEEMETGKLFLKSEHDVVSESGAYRSVLDKYEVPLGDCKDIYNSGQRESGVYNILMSNQKLLRVFCDMETDGGGWTVIQRRVDGSTDFYRNWSDYKHGFGNLGKNMWIGLENMHSLASPGSSTTLRVELKHWAKGDQLFYAKYDSFQIGNETDSYRIRVSGYSGTAGDTFNRLPSHMANNNMKFSTKDKDNDENVSSQCAIDFMGGWWYNSCHQCQLNGLFPNAANPSARYMSWASIDGNHGNIKYSEMKVRRN